MDADNPVVKLCGAGMRAEAEGRIADAAALFQQAWDVRADDFDGCVAAHYVARHQPTPDATLEWNRLALELADRVGDDRVRGFYSSLYLNLGRSHEVTGNLVEARRCYDRAGAHLGDVPAGAYGDVVRGGLSAALARVG